jgi:hypothetical protein
MKFCQHFHDPLHLLDRDLIELMSIQHLKLGHLQVFQKDRLLSLGGDHSITDGSLYESVDNAFGALKFAEQREQLFVEKRFANETRLGEEVLTPRLILRRQFDDDV